MELTQRELRRYMLRCIELAKQASPKTGKPHVGALILSSDKVIVGEGYRTVTGMESDVSFEHYHAERMALKKAGGQARGGCLVTTLEPSVPRKTNQRVHPSCELILGSGIRTVVIGCLDRYSESRGSESGVLYLTRRGVEVIVYDNLQTRIVTELIRQQS